MKKVLKIVGVLTTITVILGLAISPAFAAAAPINAWGRSWAGINVPPAGDFVDIDAGGRHTLALTAAGCVAAWGWGGQGQLAVPVGLVATAISGGRNFSLALRADGSIAGWGDDTWGNITGPTGAGAGFLAISAGYRSTLAIAADGSLVSWGAWVGAAAVPTGTDFVAIETGAHQSLALRADGTVAAWGWPLHADPAGTFTAISAGGIVGADMWNLAIRTDGSLHAWGRNPLVSVITDLPTGTDFVAIEAGNRHALALRADGSVAAWGWTIAPPLAGTDAVAGPIGAGPGHVAIAAGDYQSVVIIPEPATLILLGAGLLGLGGYAKKKTGNR